ncbi:MAG TPA: hypothetical protein IAC24_01850 [Candidatus Onthousia faecigallinarum]|nr:hypothetical protein [Candidatus Onthousia faecigallinarum]
MARNEKIMKIQKLEREMKQKRLEIIAKGDELKELEEKYNQAKASELPILLFQIDESLPMPDDRSDYRYEYVYYCPDTDEKKYIVRHSNEEFLSNTIDLRDNFSSLLVPKKSYSTSALDYSTEIDMAVSLLKSQIDNLFDSKEISDWEELGTLLKTCSFKKEKSKVLKKQ